MTFSKIPPSTSTSQQISVMNNNFQQLNAEQVTKTYNNPEGNTGLIQGILPNDLGTGLLLNDRNQVPRIAVYIDADGNPIMKVAQSGFDVTTATDEQLLFDSENGVRYTRSFSTPFTITSGASFTAGTVTIDHNLGYIPLTDNVASITTNGWAPSETGIYPLPYGSMATSGGIRGYAAYVILKRVTTSQITYEIGTTGGTFTLAGTITCYIKQSA